MGSAILESLGRSAARDAIDWRQLDIWWGDERFLPGGDPERNETQARAALLDAVHLDPARVHPMPALDGPDGPDVDAAAARYARELAAAAGRGEDVPQFDVLMLGVGPDAPRRLAVPRAPGPARARCHHGRRPWCAQAPARADLAHLSRPLRGTGRVVPRVRGGQGRGRRPGPLRFG